MFCSIIVCHCAFTLPSKKTGGILSFTSISRRQHIQLYANIIIIHLAIIIANIIAFIQCYL